MPIHEQLLVIIISLIRAQLKIFQFGKTFHRQIIRVLESHSHSILIIIYTGAYIANRVSDKITPIHDRIFVCRSGSAADTQAIADYVRYYLDMHRYVDRIARATHINESVTAWSSANCRW